MCAHSPERQLCPGLPQKTHGQQVEGGVSAPILCSGQTLLGVLRSALDPSALERRGSVGVRPEEGDKNNVFKISSLDFLHKLKIFFSDRAA